MKRIRITPGHPCPDGQSRATRMSLLILVLLLSLSLAGCGSLLRFDGSYRTYDQSWESAVSAYPLLAELPAVDGSIDCLEDLTRKGGAKVGVELNWRNRDDYVAVLDAYGEKLASLGFEEYKDAYRDPDDPYDRSFNKAWGTDADGERRFLNVSLHGFLPEYESSYNLYITASYTDLSRIGNTSESPKSGD